MKKSSASICGAIFDASGGKSAKFVSHLTRNCQIVGLIWFIPLSVHLFVSPWLSVFPCVSAKHYQHESAQRHEGYKPAHLHHPRYDQRMLVDRKSTRLNSSHANIS